MLLPCVLIVLLNAGIVWINPSSIAAIANNEAMRWGRVLNSMGTLIGGRTKNKAGKRSNPTVRASTSARPTATSHAVVDTQPVVGSGTPLKDLNPGQVQLFLICLMVTQKMLIA